MQFIHLTTVSEIHNCQLGIDISKTIKYMNIKCVSLNSYSFGEHGRIFDGGAPGPTFDVGESDPERHGPGPAESASGGGQQTHAEK